MLTDWEELQNEYDELLLKPTKSEADVRRIDEIEAVVARRWGLDSLSRLVDEETSVPGFGRPWQ